MGGGGAQRARAAAQAPPARRRRPVAPPLCGRVCTCRACAFELPKLPSRLSFCSSNTPNASTAAVLCSPACRPARRPARLLARLSRRASLRCGAGLFVSEDLLQPGQNELSVASLKNSLAGLAMAQQHPVVVAASAATAAPAAAQVVCVPVALSPSNADAAAAQAAVVAAAQQAAASGGSPSASGGQGQGGPAACRPVYVGALMLGSPHTGGLPAGLTQALQALAAAAAPYLLLLGLTKAADMADLLRLRAADCICCGGEEDELQDLPLEACRPQLSPRSSGGSAGGAASHFSDLAGSEQDSPAAQVDAAALNAAAAKALAGASNLAPPPAEAAAARASGGSSRGQRPAAAALRQRGPEQRQGKQAAGEGKAGAEAEADPKAALRRLQAATPAEAAPPPHVPTGPLLDFSDAELEARFAAAHSRSQLCGDALFCVLQLAGALTLAVLDPDALRSGTGAALTLALALPLVAMAADTDRWAARTACDALPCTCCHGRTTCSGVQQLQQALQSCAAATRMQLRLPWGCLSKSSNSAPPLPYILLQVPTQPRGHAVSSAAARGRPAAQHSRRRAAAPAPRRHRRTPALAAALHGRRGAGAVQHRLQGAAGQG